MAWVRYVFSRRCDIIARTAVFIMHLRPKCLGKWRLPLRTSKQHSTRSTPMLLPKFMLTKWPRFIVKVIVSTLPAVFYSIMKASGAPCISCCKKWPIVQNGKLALGNLKIARDWGYAGDFVRAMWLMLQQHSPEDFVIGTGRLHTLQDLCEVAYRCVDMDWRENIISDPALVRPLESTQTLADPTMACQQLGWEPTVSFAEMVEKMVAAQVERLKSNMHGAVRS